jgi:hypothetical protein
VITLGDSSVVVVISVRLTDHVAAE